MSGSELALLGASYLLGLRHGFDWDHIAAITDITSSQDNRRHALWYSTLYALGHGMVVIVLGAILILSGFAVPDGVETLMERLVGATLVFLGIWVFVSLARHGSDIRLRSRWMLLFQAIWRLNRRFQAWMRRRGLAVEHRHGSTVEHTHGPSAGHPHGAAPAREGPGAAAIAPADLPFTNYGVKTSLGVGMLHGVGAETPTQVLIFLAAAGAGGRGLGLATLFIFVAGIVTMNTIIAVGSTLGFMGAARSKRLYVAVAVVVGIFSLAIGGLFLFGLSDLLPALS